MCLIELAFVNLPSVSIHMPAHMRTHAHMWDMWAHIPSRPYMCAYVRVCVCTWTGDSQKPSNFLDFKGQFAILCQHNRYAIQMSAL